MSNETTLDDVLALHVADLRRVAKLLSPFGNFTAVKVEVGKAADELEALLPAIKAALEDARRYRFLRDKCKREWESDMPHNKGAPSLDIDFSADGHDLCAAIDAAQEVGQ